jgi:predicted metal-dependent HD superfamily phosphohydrolase
MLKEIFSGLLQSFSADENLIQKLWAEIEGYYSADARHYHSLVHLQHLYEQLLPLKKQLQDWDVVLFTLFYHDVIYKATTNDNEEQSALLAEKRMMEIGVPANQIELCKKQILATKSHQLAADSDTNYFTDADLSILGQEWELYQNYFRNVRKEYSVYPDLLYNPGRKNVLQHFLKMERIYKTSYFQALENKAKENLKREFDLL